MNRSITNPLAMFAAGNNLTFQSNPSRSNLLVSKWYLLYRAFVMLAQKFTECSLLTSVEKNN